MLFTSHLTTLRSQAVLASMDPPEHIKVRMNACPLQYACLIVLTAPLQLKYLRELYVPCRSLFQFFIYRQIRFVSTERKSER